MTELTSSGATPWANGYYRCTDHPNYYILVEGELAIPKRVIVTEGAKPSKESWKYGDFGEAHPAVAEATGKTNYDVEMTIWNGKMTLKGVLGDDGKKVKFWSITKEVAAFEWMTEEDLDIIKDSGDPADAPSSHYKIQPEKSGKMIFISGPPGLGKSTTGHLLSKVAGFVYYEGDCFTSGVNPYLPPHTKEPSVDTIKQKPLKGMPKERLDAVSNGMKDFMAMVEGKEYDGKRLEGFYKAMCKDIVQERKRLGGDWVIAHAVPFKSHRDIIKAELGPDLVFVVLNMTKENQEERLLARHGEMGNDGGKHINDMLKKLFDLYEPATEDEENAINLIVTNDMTREDVVEKILKLVN